MSTIQVGELLGFESTFLRKAAINERQRQDTDLGLQFKRYWFERELCHKIAMVAEMVKRQRSEGGPNSELPDGESGEMAGCHVAYFISRMESSKRCYKTI
ncbi:hypothetical protein BV898_01475 [Hypsibius exemplaris]|uniref:Uncharacterized protein n=1 Tax=Hypsibius exemplaris TaxID=2072580 RepID=A0A1W0XBK1_HYPEX|nr:hypothetical protein BV898_01475 [Hypsibius exemplaris]